MNQYPEKALLNAVENGNNTDIKERTVNIERATSKKDYNIFNFSILKIINTYKFNI